MHHEQSVNRIGLQGVNDIAQSREGWPRLKHVQLYMPNSRLPKNHKAHIQDSESVGTSA